MNKVSFTPSSSSKIANVILAGLSCSFAAELLWHLKGNNPLFSVLLTWFLSFPLFLIIFAQKRFYGFLSFIIATSVTLFFVPSPVSLLFALFFFLPALCAGYLLIYTPSTWKKPFHIRLSIVFFFLVLSICIIGMGVDFWMHNSEQFLLVKDSFLYKIETYALQQIETYALQATESQHHHIEMVLRLIKENFTTLLMSVVLFYSLIFNIISLYFSMRIAEKRGYLRGRTFWPRDLRLPPLAVSIFFISFFMSLIIKETYFSTIFFTLNLGFNIALSMVGLAYLHYITKRMKLRFLILFFTYFALFSIFFSAPISVLLLFMGIWASARPRKLLY